LLDLAMLGRRPKLDILMFLIQKGLSIDDVKDASLASKTLQTILKGGKIASPNLFQLPTSRSNNDCILLMLEDDNNDNNDSRRNQTSAMHDTSNVTPYPIDESVTIVEDMCTLCCEKTMDCVLVPCGHQLCCSGCGSHLRKCPVCQSHCTVLRIYRQ
jgi:Zinc finger, C3HC4 type (RING finger)